VKIPRWAIALVVVLGLGALAVRAIRMPSSPLQAAPFEPPKLQPKGVPRDGGNPEEEGTGMEEAPMMPVGTVEHPEQLDRRQLENTMDKVKHAVDQKCRGLEPFIGTLTIKLTIGQSGNVKSATAVPPREGSPVAPAMLEKCVIKEVKHANFPRFRGTLIPTIELTYPFLFKED
jgi:hypothetical protein